ncbi:MAG: aldo/keto reductase [Anaerolineae bacterium]|nr:aldo/keto reductase [Anaerolineae bacterium]
MRDPLGRVRGLLRQRGQSLEPAPAGVGAHLVVVGTVRSEVTIPIPGIRTVAQAEENAGALRLGPLTADQMRQIDALAGEGAGN